MALLWEGEGQDSDTTLSSIAIEEGPTPSFEGKRRKDRLEKQDWECRKRAFSKTL